MRKIIPYCFAIASIAVQAQSVDTTYSFEGDVLVSEKRINIPFNDASRTIEVLDKTEIEGLNATSINQVLQIISGVDIRQRGVHGVQADLSIRGGTFEQTLVLINGVKMLDPQTGHHMMNLPVTLADIERIEVLKGPGARIYGQNAFAGAINIVTKTTADHGVSAGMSLGAFGLLGACVSANLPVNEFHQRISISADHSNGYRDNTDFDIVNLFYQGDTRIGGNGSLGLMAGFTLRDFGANGFYGNETFTEQYERTRTGFVNASYSFSSNDWKIAPSISWRRNYDNWMFQRSNPDFFQNFHTSHVITGEMNTSKFHESGIFGMGIEYNRIILNSNNLGDHARDQFGLHLENRFLFSGENIDLTPGLFILSISDFGTEFYPGIDLGIRLSNQWKTYANFGYTSRIPSFTDLYYEDRGNIGNPDLVQESAFTYEVGAKFQRQNSSIQLSFFRRTANDLIDWFKINPDDRWMPDNFGSASFTGIDLTSTFAFEKINALKFLRFSYAYLHANLNDSDFALSRNALENLRHQLIVHPQFQINDDLLFNFLLKYNDRVSLDDYGVLDTNVTWRFEKFDVSITANNLFGAEYRETDLVPMPGRWIRASIRWSM